MLDKKLTTTDHSRDIAGLKYIYPVLSRRAGGLSIGINFNINNACNWRCVYCQVPDLSRGTAPKMDFFLLENELRFFLDSVLKGDFFNQFNVPEKHRIIKDIAISGNGEPTSLKHFDKAVDLIGRIATEMDVLPESDLVLITNGSLMHQASVQEGLRILNNYHGQVWFKLDSATEEGRKKINDSRQSNKNTRKNLTISSGLCETSLQTCMMEDLSVIEAENEQLAYLQLLNGLKQDQTMIKKIMLYTIARPSLQPEASQMNKLDGDLMKQFADRITSLGYQVSIST